MCLPCRIYTLHGHVDLLGVNVYKTGSGECKFHYFRLGTKWVRCSQKQSRCSKSCYPADSTVSFECLTRQTYVVKALINVA